MRRRVLYRVFGFLRGRKTPAPIDVPVVISTRNAQPPPLPSSFRRMRAFIAAAKRARGTLDYVRVSASERAFLRRLAGSAEQRLAILAGGLPLVIAGSRADYRRRVRGERAFDLVIVRW